MHRLIRATTHPEAPYFTRTCAEQRAPQRAVFGNQLLGGIGVAGVNNRVGFGHLLRLIIKHNLDPRAALYDLPAPIRMPVASGL